MVNVISVCKKYYLIENSYLKNFVMLLKLMSQENQQINIAKELQEYLDENKEKLSSEIYKNISELNLKQFNVQQNNFYKVTYLIQKLRKYDQYQVGIKAEKKSSIVKIPEEVYTELKKHIDDGKNCIDCNLQFYIVKNQLNIEDLYLTFEGESTCDDTDCLESSDYFREIHFNNSVSVLAIEKA